MKKIFIFLLFLQTTSIVFAQSAEDLLKSGNQKFNQQNYLEAKKDYEQAIKINPNLAKAHHNLGNINYILQDYDLALNNFSQAIELSPNDSEPYVSRAAMLLSLKRFKEALQDLEKAISINPNSSGAFYIRGDLYFASNKKTEACQDWKKAFTLGHPQAIDKLQANCKGIVEIPKITKQDKNTKIKSLETANDFFKIGGKQMEVRDYQGAIKAFNKAIELDEDYAEAYFGRAGAKFAKGDHDGACEDWKKSLALGYKKAKEMLEHGCQ